MKILLTNRSLAHYRGTETWTYTMAKELSKQHEVTVLTNELGRVSDDINEFAKVITAYNGEYDFAICNHLDTYIKLPADLFKIYTSHSCFVPLEQFPDTANVRVGVTEEIGGELIIPNGIDTDRFHYEPINEKLTTILYLSSPLYQGGKQFMRNALGDKYNLITIERETKNVEDLIYKADLVIGFGRGILEAMSCGRNVISADYRITYMDGVYGGGMVTEENFDKLAQNNFTGRPKSIQFTIPKFLKEVKKYDADRGKFLSDKIKEEYNIQKTAQQYVELFTSKK